MLDPESYPDTPSTPPVYVDFSTLPSTSAGAIHFGDYGPLCARQGWAVFPQERDGRKPGIVDGEMLKWSKYQVIGPDVATVDRWSRQAYGLNVAAIMGEATSLCFALDIDVADVDLSEDIQLAAARTLGETKFQRIGNWPKIALIYRVASRDDLPANHTLTLSKEDGSGPSEHQIEFQGQGKAITIHGRHHKTGERFVWPTGKMPMNKPPTFAPVVTTEQLAAFVEAVREIRPIHERATGGSGLEGLEFVETEGVRKPRMASAGGVDWTTEDGLVVDGRERYLTRLVFETVRGNPQLVEDPAGVAQLKKSVLEEFRRTARLDGRWKTAHLARSIAEKVRRNVRQLNDGTITVSKRAIRTAAAPTTEAQRAAVALGGPEVERISAEMRERVDAFWNAVLAYDPDGGKLPPFHLLKSPVGTGKTSIALASTLRTLRLQTVLERKVAGAISGTIGMLLPSHQNVDEVLEKAKGLGLKAVAHRGQAHEDGGCEQREIVAMLQSAGISASKLCKSKIDGQAVFCKHHPEAGGACPRMAAMASMLENDVVVSVHAYGLREPPAPFKDFAAVIVDENLAGGLIGTALLERKVLDEKRRAIMPTMAERKEMWGDRSPTEEDFVEFDHFYAEKRFKLVELCNAAWDGGRDPAFEIAGHPERRDWIEAAKTIASRASRIAADITPATTFQQAAQLAETVHGRQIGLEARLWMLLAERVEAVEESRSIVDDGSTPVLHASDDRVWPFRDEARSLQLSWTGEYSLSHLPTLYMDASVNPRLLSMFLGRAPDDIVCRPIQADLRLDVTLIDDNTYTKRRFFPGDKASTKQRTDATALMKGVRMFLAKTGAVHGDGGTLFIAPQEVEEAILEKWAPPANMDSMHFGATAGLDWAKRHSAAVLIGALYPDVATIDGLVAALTYRDPVPTERMDPDGTGAVRPFKMVDDAIPLRDGTFHAGRRLEYPTAMANDLLTQIRDEQLVQALGRLRSVYREDTPRLYILGNAVPRGLIVDRVSTLRREGEDLGDLLAAAHGRDDVDQRISRELAEAKAMTVAFRRFSARIDADPEFAKAFHCITSGTGERSWLPAYIDGEIAMAHASKVGGTAAMASLREFGRPKYERFRKGPSRELEEFLLQMRDRKRLQALPLQQRIEIQDAHGAGAEEELIRVARQTEEAWQAHVTALREEHKRRPETDDPFQFISWEALEIPTGWENITPAH